MTKYRYRGRDVDEAEALDENGVLLDGFSMLLPTTLRDALTPLRVTAANGGTAGLHRPGYRIADANDDARLRAYDEYRRDIENAWRGSGAEGTPDELQRDALPTRDDMTLDELQCDHQRRMSCEYQAYGSWIEHQWRNP
jgi:hypothetical protein